MNDSKKLEKIFLYFAEPETTFIIYKKFCEDIFYFTSTEERNKKNKNFNNEHYKKESFIEILTRKIMDKSGPFTLLELIKNIKIIDYENCNIIFFSDFIRALKRIDIFLEEEERVTLFEECDFYNNKNLHYENMFNILVNQFWTEEKSDLCEEIYFSLTNNGKQCISINYIQKKLKNILGDNNFHNFIEQYKLIYKNSSLEPITLKDFIKLFKYYNFGNYEIDVLNDLLSAINRNFNNDNKCGICSQIKNYFNHGNKTSNSKKHHYSKSVAKNNIKTKEINNKDNNLYKIIIKIKNIFIEYGRISLFNFIKQFKYYETNDNLINRSSFLKVLNNFNINLSTDDIDNIFNEFGIDYSKNYLYHEDFIKYISVKYMNKKRDDIIKYIYDSLLEKNGKCEGDLTIKYLKDEYNAKNNYFIKDEGNNYLEFIDCLEIFHFDYKRYKHENFDKKEFVDFYRLISFLINDDNNFFYLISNEWGITLDNIGNNFLNTKQKKISDDEKISDKVENDFLIDLKNKLIKLGVKGLLNIHWKFLTFCPDVTKIKLNDFINIMNLNNINFGLNEFKNIFDYFSINQKNIYLDFNRFIRFFKKELNETKLNMLEKIFLSLKYDYSENDEEIPLYIIQNKYKAKRHPKVVSGKIKEDEKIKEFRESFDINYKIFNSNHNNDKKEKLIDFDIFANFYEYVSFIYENDDEFVNLLISTWC